MRRCVFSQFWSTSGGRTHDRACRAGAAGGSHPTAFPETPRSEFQRRREAFDVLIPYLRLPWFKVAAAVSGTPPIISGIGRLTVRLGSVSMAEHEGPAEAVDSVRAQPGLPLDLDDERVESENDADDLDLELDLELEDEEEE